MKYICVFCGSSEAGADKYKEAAEQLGKAIVEKGYGLVFGGGNVGLMKILADSVKAAGGEVIGVVTQEVVKLGVVYKGIAIHEEPTYSARKAKMAALADGFIALPGGLGTVDELTEVMIHNQFASYKNTSDNPVKPCSVLNVDGFYNGLVEQMKRCRQENFITEKHFNMVYFSSDPQDAVKQIVNFKSPVPDASKWWEKEEKSKRLETLSLPKEEAIPEEVYTRQLPSWVPYGAMVVGYGLMFCGLFAKLISNRKKEAAFLVADTVKKTLS